MHDDATRLYRGDRRLAGEFAPDGINDEIEMGILRGILRGIDYPADTGFFRSAATQGVGICEGNVANTPVGQAERREKSD